MREALLTYSSDSKVKGGVCMQLWLRFAHTCAMNHQSFHRLELMESTSMVNSPVDLELFDAQNEGRPPKPGSGAAVAAEQVAGSSSGSSLSQAAAFPLFHRARQRALECSVGEGEALYLPAFWW